MKHYLVACVLGMGVVGFLGPATASAQLYPSYSSPYGGAYRRMQPALSPYLNLTRSGNPAANYFLGVLPEIERRQVEAMQGAAILDLERRLDTPAPTEEALPTRLEGPLPPTGHAAAFATYSTYYSLPSAPSQAATTRQTLRPRGR
jgi:hypothetical protein